MLHNCLDFLCLWQLLFLHNWEKLGLQLWLWSLPVALSHLVPSHPCASNLYPKPITVPFLIVDIEKLRDTDFPRYFVSELCNVLNIFVVSNATIIFFVRFIEFQILDFILCKCWGFVVLDFSIFIFGVAAYVLLHRYHQCHWAFKWH